MSRLSSLSWTLYPLASALLLVLSFYPYKLWYLSFVALVPLFYFLFYTNHVTPRRAFFGVGFVALFFSMSIAYFTLMQFNWLSETYLFNWLTRLSFIPIALITGGTVGLAAILLMRIVRAHPFSPFWNVVLFATTWTLTEWLFSIIFAGFHYGVLAHTVVSVTPLRLCATLGGTPLVTFLVVIINGAFATGVSAVIAYRAHLPLAPYRTCARGLFAIALTLTAAVSAQVAYLHGAPSSGRDISFALIQVQSRANDAFGSFSEGAFSFPALEKYVAQAAPREPTFIIYPFSSFVGVIAADPHPPLFDREVIAGTVPALGAWVQAHIPPTSVFVTWNNVLRGRTFYNEFNFWQGDTLIAYYQKRHIFPYMDYTPALSQRIGLYSTPFDAVAGTSDQAITIEALPIGSLICSEVNEPALARADSRHATILFSIGSEAMFRDSVAGDINLTNARYRAVETNRPVVRDDRLGPSALIDNTGAFIERMSFGEEGVLIGSLFVADNPRDTLYSHTGDVPFILILTLLLGYHTVATLRKRRA